MSMRIVTDSTADLPPEIVERFGITVVPLSILFGDEELSDGIDITSEQFFRRLTREAGVPTTSQPSAGAFREQYERLAREGADTILSIHISGLLSGTLESARQGAAGLEGVRIEVVDSRYASLALGMGVIAAAEAAERGADVEQARAAAEDVFRRTHLFVMLDTLEYLRRGGRMGRGMEVLASLLKVKPIIGVVDGEVAPLGRVRTRSKAIEDLLTRATDLRPIQYAAALHATSPDDLDYLARRLHGIAPDANVLTARITPVIGVHTGPGALGVAVVTAADEDSPEASPPTASP